MDNLEKFIKDHKSEFDVETPRTELWDQLNQKRGKTKPTKRISMFPYKTLRIAASIVILAFAVYGAYNLFAPTPTETTASTEVTLPAELVELDQYYEGQVKVQFTKVNQLIDDEEILDDIKSDLEMLNDEKVALMEEYGTHIDDEEVVEALINTYRMKIHILEDILSIINEQEIENEQAI